MGQTSFTVDALIDFPEKVDDRVAALLVAGTAISIVYNDTAGTLTINGQPGVTDHGELTGLSDDDHPQYLLANGSRAASSVKLYNANGNPWIESYSNAGISAMSSQGQLGAFNAAYFIVAATGYYYFSGRALMTSSANGAIHVQNYNFDDVTADQALVFGPGTTTSNGVRLKRAMGSMQLQLLNGNGSAFGDFVANKVHLGGSGFGFIAANSYGVQIGNGATGATITTDSSHVTTLAGVLKFPASGANVIQMRDMTQGTFANVIENGFLGFNVGRTDVPLNLKSSVVNIGGSNAGFSGTGIAINPSIGRISGNSWPSNDYGYVDVINSVRMGRGNNLTFVIDGDYINCFRPITFAPYTFATVPTASNANFVGATIRITDRAHRLATSDGINWNWAGTTTPIS